MIRDQYQREASALWARLGRLGEECPRLEGLYARDADPRVARLVQSAAFAFARAQNRLDDDAQALVRPLVARALPECLRPRPSSTIVELTAGTGRGGPVAGVSFVARRGGMRMPFQTVWPAMVTPLALRDVGVDRLDAQRQVLRLSLVGGTGQSLGEALRGPVRLFLNLEPRRLALDVIHALRESHEPGRVLALGKSGAPLSDRRLPERAVSWVGMDTDEAPLVSARADRFVASRLLGELFACPETFCFFDLHLGEVPQESHRLDVVLPLAHVIDGAARLSTEHLRLRCAPATNQFVTAIEPVPGPGASEAVLAVPGKPRAEILEVRSLSVASIREAGRRTPLRSWEAPVDPHRLGGNAMYYALAQELAATDGRTQLRATFGRLDAFPGPAGGTVEGEVLACDGEGTAPLGLGDVGSARDGGVNITRVTPSRRALLGRNHAWRMSAYARMAPGRLADARRLADFVGLHDPHGRQDEATRVVQPRWRSVDHRREHALRGGALGWGDAYVVDAEAGAGAGELWLVGALVHRALAERTEALRFARTVLLREGLPFAEYGARPGGRLPFPLG